MKLSNAKLNTYYKILKIEDCLLKERLLVLGFTKNSLVKVIKKSVFKETLLVEVIGGVLAIRKQLAENIIIEGENESSTCR